MGSNGTSRRPRAQEYPIYNLIWNGAFILWRAEDLGSVRGCAPCACRNRKEAPNSDPKLYANEIPQANSANLYFIMKRKIEKGIVYVHDV